MMITIISQKTEKPIVEWNDDRERFQIKVDGRDQGRIVGKSGITIWAIGTMIWYAGYAHAKGPIQIKLELPDKTDTQPRLPFKLNPDWDREKLVNLINLIALTTLKEKKNWQIEDHQNGEADVTFSIREKFRPALAEPSYEEALKTVIHAAAASLGAIVKTTIKWS